MAKKEEEYYNPKTGSFEKGSSKSIKEERKVNWVQIVLWSIVAVIVLIKIIAASS